VVSLGIARVEVYMGIKGVMDMVCLDIEGIEICLGMEESLNLLSFFLSPVLIIVFNYSEAWWSSG